MWYAIEYAYGSQVVNNGNRGDRVLEFSAKRLRDAWVGDGAAYDGPGYRETISARHPVVRNAGWVGLDNGDREGWQVLARQRMENSMNAHAMLFRYLQETLPTDDLRWIATGDQQEILQWAKETEQKVFPL